MSDKPGTGNREPGAGNRAFARSLYWRIGFGFILFLAITLILQVGLFIWVAGETEGGMPERMGRDFAELVASEFESALARDPQLDLRAYAERRVKELHRPAAIIFPDGSAIAPKAPRSRVGCAFRAVRWEAALGSGRTGQTARSLMTSDRAVRRHSMVAAARLMAACRMFSRLPRPVDI